MAEGDGLANTAVEGDNMPYFEDTLTTTADSDVPEPINATEWSYKMGWLCSETDPLLDTSVSWNTQSPDISVCLQKSLLIWVPCGFLWVMAPFLIYRLYRSKSLYIPHTLLNIIQTVLAAGLGLFAGADLIYFATKESEATVDVLDPIIRGLTWLLVVALIQLGRVRGSRNSAVLWIFWCVFILFSLPRLYSQMRRELDSETPSDLTEVISNTLTLVIAVVQWVLAFFMDAKPAYIVGEGPDDSTIPCPETTSSFPSIITFSWFDSLAWTGYKRTILDADLWELNPRDQSATVAPVFDNNWGPKLKAANLTSRGKVDGGEVVIETGKKKSPKESLSIFLPLVKSFGMSFLLGSVLKFFHDIMVFIAPMLLRRIIAFSEPVCEGCTQSPVWQGILYAIALLLVALFQTILLSTYFYWMYLIGLWTKSALISALYRKSLTVTAESKKGSTSGEIVNLMSVDCQKIGDILPYLNMLWSSPLQITVAIYLLYQILGASVIAGLVVMIVLIPVNGFSAAITRKLQVKMMKQKDIRVKKMNELLSGMKILKLYAWEPSFMQEVVDIRNSELKILLNIGYLSAAISFIWTCAPFVVSLVTFAVYVLSDENNVLDAQKAFTSLALFNILRFPLSMLPMMITSAIQASVSIKRINKFMRCEELDPNSIVKNDKSSEAISVSNASFNWGEKEDDTSNQNGDVKDKKKKKGDKSPKKNGVVTNGDTKPEAVNGNGNHIDGEEMKPLNGNANKIKIEPFSLQNIDLKIPKGSLCAVVGTVGAGKSSLLSALLGEMERSSGQVEISGRIAYVSQQAWIQNAKLKDNILFGSKMDTDKYKKAIDDCALTSDLEILPAQDETEIGEKGINLSGGQKQRVAVARAVYADADLYLLDDPLSAVDSHVGKHIFDKVIGPQGCLKTKTRVLVTHGVTFLPQVDKIVVLKKGVISEVGSYRELLAQKGDFAEFLIQYLSDQDDDSELANIKKELQEHLGQDELVRQISRVRTESEGQHSNPQKGGSNTSLANSIHDESPRKSVSPVKSPSTKPEPSKKPQQQYQEEKQGTGSVSWRIYLIYFKNMGYIMFSLCVILYAVYQIFTTFSSIWVSLWADNRFPFEAVLHNTNVTRNMTDYRRDVFLGVYGSMGFAQAIGAVLASLFLYLSTIKGGRALHHRMLDRIMHSPMSFFDTTPQGRLLNRFGKDVDVLDSTMPMVLRGWITCLLSVIATFLVIMVTTPLAIIPIFIVLSGYYFVQRVYVAASRQLKRLESTTRSPIYSHFGETINGASVIRAYGLQNTFIRESEKRVDKNHQAAFTGVIGNRWLAVRLETVGNCIIFAAALFAVLGRDSLTPGLVGLSVSYALQVTQTLNWLVRMTSEVETNIVAVERLDEYSQIETEADWEKSETTVDESWPAEGQISLVNYSTRYRSGLDLVLKDITASFKGGERVGIVGRTGAGKSSLTLALFRLIEPAEGTIKIDGVDITTLGLHKLRSRLTIIPQDPVLFSGTLRHNLDPFEQYSDEAVWAALRQSHLSEFVSGLSSSLQHEVSEGGENLSVGQRQLICLARALLRKTKVLVLDEATAAVDLETDDLIQSTIRSEFKGCTIITIAHRLNTVLDYDRILVLKEGGIAELDSPKNLMQQDGGIFRGMCQDAGLL
eukprot:TRINITY_DN11824_c0_g1_i1.p1 TRINITY_DN11824_c0_g1~~TRINITY_DN11824_c0_g1_i1.p1  ORF type:complete len:1639 (-),score=332.95 TRINITY_DN11824_c0_g1_i1:544-5460(-)